MLPLPLLASLCRIHGIYLGLPIRLHLYKGHEFHRQHSSITSFSVWYHDVYPSLLLWPAAPQPPFGQPTSTREAASSASNPTLKEATAAAEPVLCRLVVFVDWHRHSKALACQCHCTAPPPPPPPRLHMAPPAARGPMRCGTSQLCCSVRRGAAVWLADDTSFEGMRRLAMLGAKEREVRPDKKVWTELPAPYLPEHHGLFLILPSSPLLNRLLHSCRVLLSLLLPSHVGGPVFACIIWQQHPHCLESARNHRHSPSPAAPFPTTIPFLPSADRQQRLRSKPRQHTHCSTP